MWIVGREYGRAHLRGTWDQTRGHMLRGRWQAGMLSRYLEIGAVGDRAFCAMADGAIPGSLWRKREGDVG